MLQHGVLAPVGVVEPAHKREPPGLVVEPATQTIRNLVVWEVAPPDSSATPANSVKIVLSVGVPAPVLLTVVGMWVHELQSPVERPTLKLVIWVILALAERSVWEPTVSTVVSPMLQHGVPVPVGVVEPAHNREPLGLAVEPAT